MADMRRNTAERCMRRILWMLRIDEEAYCWLKYEYGLQYLYAYLKNDSHAIGIIERSPVFWAWWKNHWTLREEAFLQDAEQLDKISLSTRRNAYHALHNPMALAAEIHPNAAVLGDSYDKMIQELIKTEA